MSSGSWWYRNGDTRYPFAWETSDQPAARWHADGGGPACYLADTPDGAWAEFLRHEEITEVADLDGIRRRIWAVEVDEQVVAAATTPPLPQETVTGGRSTYPQCRTAADAARATGAHAIKVPSAALVPGGAGGQETRAGLVEASPRSGRVLVVFGSPTGLRAWAAVDHGQPTERVLRRTQQF